MSPPCYYIGQLNGHPSIICQQVQTPHLRVLKERVSLN